jgi:putative acetyltransferase
MLDVVLDDRRPVAAASLAPLAVLPAHQRAGVGAVLTRRGLDRLRSQGIAVAIVLGHPEYYPRFGFSAALARRLRGPFSGPSWMAIELIPGALQDATGTVRYPAAFRIDDPT